MARKKNTEVAALEVETLAPPAEIVIDLPENDTLPSEDLTAIAEALEDLNAPEPDQAADENAEETEEPAELTLREYALAVPQDRVDTMIADIEASVVRRHSFETNGGTSPAGGSWATAVKQIGEARVSLARMFIALGVTPANVFERQLVEGKMFNAKSIKKIVELAQYVTGTGSRMERVTRAFLACTILATRKWGDVPITNTINAKFLSGADLTRWIADPELIDDLRDMRHTGMTSGAATQSSQARNVIDVLGMGEVTKVERARDAVVIDLDNPLIKMFGEDFLLTA